MGKLILTIKVDEYIQFLRIVKAYLHTGARRNELLPPLFTWDNVVQLIIGNILHISKTNKLV